MKKILTAPVQIWHVILVAVLVASLTSTMVVSAASPSAFLTQGTMRMGFAQVNPGPSIATNTNVTVLKQVITIPAGKVADIAAFSEVDIQGGSAAAGYEYCFGQYRLDHPNNTGTQFLPGNYILKGFSPPDANNLSVPINGYLANVPAGTHTVFLVMSASYQSCIINMGSMILLANIH